MVQIEYQSKILSTICRCAAKFDVTDGSTCVQDCKNESRARHAQLTAAGMSAVGRGRSSGVKRSAEEEAPMPQPHDVLDMHLQLPGAQQEQPYAAPMEHHLHAGQATAHMRAATQHTHACRPADVEMPAPVNLQGRCRWS